MFSSCRACTEMTVTTLQVPAASSHLRARCSQRTLFSLQSSPRRPPARARSIQAYRHYLLTTQATAVLHAVLSRLDYASVKPDIRPIEYGQCHCSVIVMDRLVGEQIPIENIRTSRAA